MERLKEDQVCLNCDRKLTGRRDKKFCDSQCKAEFHNQNKSAGEIHIAKSQRILRHNRKILKSLSPAGKATVRKEILDKMGFNYLYFSGLYNSPNSGPLYYLSYDYGFAPIYERGIEKALIINRQPYMDSPSFPIWNPKKKT